MAIEYQNEPQEDVPPIPQVIRDATITINAPERNMIDTAIKSEDATDDTMDTHVHENSGIELVTSDVMENKGAGCSSWRAHGLPREIFVKILRFSVRCAPVDAWLSLRHASTLCKQQMERGFAWRFITKMVVHYTDVVQFGPNGKRESWSKQLTFYDFDEEGKRSKALFLDRNEPWATDDRERGDGRVVHRVSSQTLSLR